MPVIAHASGVEAQRIFSRSLFFQLRTFGWQEARLAVRREKISIRKEARLSSPD